MSKMGILHLSVLLRRADLRCGRAEHRISSHKYFTGTAVAHRGRGPCGDRRRSGAAPPRCVQRCRRFDRAMLDVGGEYAFRVRGEEHVWNAGHCRGAAARRARQFLRQVSAVRPRDQRAIASSAYNSRSIPHQIGGRGWPSAGADRRSRTGEEHRQALLNRRDVVRVDFARSAYDAGHRHEPDRRQVQYRRRRGGIGRASSRCRTAIRCAPRSSRWRPRSASV